jgi:hypothetical protein
VPVPDEQFTFQGTMLIKFEPQSWFDAKGNYYEETPEEAMARIAEEIRRASGVMGVLECTLAGDCQQD